VVARSEVLVLKNLARHRPRRVQERVREAGLDSKVFNTSKRLRGLLLLVLVLARQRRGSEVG
jgi:hypothetical protein